MNNREEDDQSLPSSSSDDDNHVFEEEGKLMDELEGDGNATDSSQYSQESDEDEGRMKKRPRKKPKNDHPTKQDKETSPTVNDKRAEARKDFDDALAKINAGKVRRRRATADSSDVMYDDDAISLHSQMIRAVQQDNESIKAGRPALKKLELLPEVQRIINIQHMQEFLLDNRILEAIRMWLEPLPNGCLPSVDLRLALLNALHLLTPSIDTQLLRGSRVGRIVMFFSVREGEFPPIKRLASQLVTIWSRPIVGQSADFKSARRDDFVQSEGLKRREEGEDGGDTGTKQSSSYSKLSHHLSSSHQKRRK